MPVHSLSEWSNRQRFLLKTILALVERMSLRELVRPIASCMCTVIKISATFNYKSIICSRVIALKMADPRAFHL